MAASGLNNVRNVKGDGSITVRWNHLATLVEFALELKKALQCINEQSFNHFVLKMGINHGPITAGVIGARKPHYDIWVCLLYSIYLRKKKTFIPKLNFFWQATWISISVCRVIRWMLLAAWRALEKLAQFKLRKRHVKFYKNTVIVSNSVDWLLSKAKENLWHTIWNRWVFLSGFFSRVVLKIHYYFVRQFYTKIKIFIRVKHRTEYKIHHYHPHCHFQHAISFHPKPVSAKKQLPISRMSHWRQKLIKKSLHHRYHLARIVQVVFVSIKIMTQVMCDSEH